MASETINGERMLTLVELERLRGLIEEDIEMGIKNLNWVLYADILRDEQEVSDGEAPIRISLCDVIVKRLRERSKA